MTKYKASMRTNRSDPNASAVDLRRNTDPDAVPQTATSTQNGALSFIFETGSGLRSGGRNVRSQAARHGWTSRQRAPKSDDAHKPKRRKLQHHNASEEHQSQKLTVEIDPISSGSGPSSRPYGLLTPNLAPITLPTSSSTSSSLSAISSPVSWPSHWSNNPLPSPFLTPPPNSRTSVFDKGELGSSERCLTRTTRSSSPFLHVVMNEVYPLYSQVDHRGNPFGAFPTPWRSFYGTLVEHYFAITSLHSKEINADQELTTCVCEVPLQLSIVEQEPALFFAIMGTTAAVLDKRDVSLELPPQWFQTKAVKMLNAAIADPKRAFSSATILTVSLIAFFESTIGHAQMAASVHQPALRMMVNARGGLGALFHNDPNGPQLVRYLVWTDRVISSQCGNALMFPGWNDEVISMTQWSGIWVRMWKHSTAIQVLQPKPASRPPS